MAASVAQCSLGNRGRTSWTQGRMLQENGASLSNSGRLRRLSTYGTSLSQETARQLDAAFRSRMSFGIRCAASCFVENSSRSSRVVEQECDAAATSDNEASLREDQELERRQCMGSESCALHLRSQGGLASSRPCEELHSVLVND